MEELSNPNKPVENRREDGTFGPGNNANPKGRPKGKTLKEWVKDKLMSMTDEERTEFLKGVPLDLQWKMAEGNPATENEHRGEFKVQILPSEVIEKNEFQIPSEPIIDSKGQEPV